MLLLGTALTQKENTLYFFYLCVFFFFCFFFYHVLVSSSSTFYLCGSFKYRILKQKKFTTLCTSTRTWASGPLKLTPWVEFTKRKSPLKLPSSQPPPRPPLSRGSKPSTQPTFRETSPSTNFSNIPSARPASSRANILPRSALSKETDSKGPTTQSTQSTSREIPCDSNFSDLNPNLKNSSSFSSSPSASSSSVPPKTWEQFMKDTEDFEPHWFVKKVPGTSPSKSPGQRKKKRK